VGVDADASKPALAKLSLLFFRIHAIVTTRCLKIASPNEALHVGWLTACVQEAGDHSATTAATSVAFGSDRGKSRSFRVDCVGADTETPSLSIAYMFRLSPRRRLAAGPPSPTP
jgi:hypothetical protein